MSMFTNRSLHKGLTYVTTVTTIVWSMGGALLAPLATHAAVAATVINPITVEGFPNKVKAPASVIPITFAATQSAGETFTSFTFTLEDRGGPTAISASDFGQTLPILGAQKALIVRDNTNPSEDDFSDDSANIVGSTNTLNVGSATTIIMTTTDLKTSGEMASRGDYEYALVLLTGPSATEGRKFRVTTAGTEAGAINTSVDESTGDDITVAAVTGSDITIDLTAPTATGAGGPPDGQSFVPPDALIDRVFSEALSGVKAVEANISLKRCTGTQTGADAACGVAAAASPTVEEVNKCAVANGGSVALSDNNTKVTCNHTPLVTNTWYEFRFTTTVSDVASNPLAAIQDYRFKTSEFFGGSGGSNTTPPRVQSTTPKAGTFDLPTNANLYANFSLGAEGDMLADGSANAVNNTSNVRLNKIVNFAPSGTNACAGVGCVLTWDSTLRQLKINPASNLDASSEYDFCIAGTVRNQQSQTIGGDFCTRFKTGSGADSTAPTIRTTNATSPANAATNQSRYNLPLQMFFSEDLDPSTVTLNNVRLVDTGVDNTLAGGDTRLTSSELSIRYDSFSRGVYFGLKSALTASRKYCFEATTSVKDLAGNSMATTDATQCFTTGSAADATGATLTFVDADNFKAIAKFNESLNATQAETATNYTFECPVGVTISVSGAGRLKYNAETKEVEIRDLGLQPGQNCRLTIGTGLTDLAGNNFSGTTNVANFQVLNSSTTGGNLGGAPQQDFQSGTNFGTFWANPERCQPRSTIAGKSTSMECEFSAPSALTSGATFLLTFPSGFTVTSVTPKSGLPGSPNEDLNGPGPGITTIDASADTGGFTDGVAVDNGAGTVTVKIAHTGTAMGSSDHIRFELNGVTNPSVPANDQRISIVIKDSSGVKVGQTINAQPFSIQQFSGTALTISGSVYKDTNGDGDKDLGEGINGVTVFCDSQGGFTSSGGEAGVNAGHQESTTAGNGAWSITDLSDGNYGCGMAPDPTNFADMAGGNYFQNVSLVGASKTAVDFAFKDLSSTGKSLSVTLAGGPASEVVDVFCHAGGQTTGFSAPVFKSITLNGSGAGSTTVKLQPSTNYDCGVGPHIEFTQFAAGGPPPVPEFNFMPPQPQKVFVPAASNPTAITFNLVSASNTIPGTLKDGSNNGIANAFVRAEPVGCFDSSTGAFKECHGSFAQSKSDGSFTLNVGPGTYEVVADAPGLPQSTREEVSVQTDGSLKSKGSVITTVALKMSKSSTTIAGTVKDESGNGIKFAHVSGQRISTGTTCSSFTPAGGFADSPTDSSGAYTLYVSSGTWCVRAFSPSYGEVGNRTVVVSSSSQTSQDISATAADFGTISGTVTKGGSAASGAFVNCFGSSGGNNAQTNSDGTYSMKLKAGSGYICDGFLPGVGPLPRNSSFTVSANATSTKNFTVGNPGTVRVTITGITDAFCDARDSSGNGNGTNQNNDGVYDVYVPAGTYTVRCGSPKYGSIVNQSGTVATAGATTTVSGTAPTTRSVLGRVTDGSSNVEGVSVTFTDTTLGKSFTVKTGAEPGSNNNLSGTGIPEGTYTLSASKKGYEPASTTATVTGGTLTLSSPIAMTKASGANGTSASITVQESGSAYTGEANVIATKDGKVVVGEIDSTTGLASLPLTNGTWTVKAVGDNGKESSTSSVTIAAGAVSGSAPTLSLSTSITGFTSANESETVALNAGGLLKFEDVSVGGVPVELNVPASTLSTSDTSTGKIEVKTDPTIVVDPGTNQNFVGSNGYEITPKDANGSAISDISGTVKITIPYTDADVTAAGVEESQMVVAAFDTTSQSWESFSTTVDTTNNLLVAEVSHFSSFGVIGTVTSSSSGGRTDTTPPGEAKTVSGSSADGKITVTWSDPSDSDLKDIAIYRNFNPSGTAVNGATPYAVILKGVQTFTDTGPFTSGTGPYKYQLVARDSAGNTSVGTTVVSVTLVPTTSSGGNAGGSSGGSSGGGTGATTVTTPTTTTTTTTVTPTTTTTVPVVTKDARTLQLEKIGVESSLVVGGDAPTLARLTNQGVSPAAEANALVKYIKKLTKALLSPSQEASMKLFVTYGTETTKKLGEGERAGVINSFQSAYGRLPESTMDWQDVMKIGNGRFPSQISTPAELGAKAQFKVVYKREASMTQANDSAAINIMAYGLRNEVRNLSSEAAAIKSFRAIFKRSPASAADWDVMRAISYSGAKR